MSVKKASVLVNALKTAIGVGFLLLSSFCFAQGNLALVSITSPTNGEVLYAPAQIRLAVFQSGVAGNAELFADGKNLGQAITSPLANTPRAVSNPLRT